MALVQLLQPTDMNLITAPSAFDNAGVTSTAVNEYGGLPATPFFFSFIGHDFTPMFGGLATGTVQTAAYDGADPDMIPEIFITNLNFDVTTSGFNVLLYDFQNEIRTLLAGNDTVIGSAGNDTILGFAGNDVLRGGGGLLDRFEGGAGADKLIGGPGSDQAQYTFAPGGVVADLLHPNRNTGEATGDTYVAIDSLRGTNFSDSLFGNNGANSIGGWFGGNDRLFGRGGADFLASWTGNDLLDGGTGRDTLTGAAGSDRFDFNSIADSKPGSARDVIEDFSSAELDRIDLSTIDADQRANRPGNQAFQYIGGDTFGHYHSLHPGIYAMVRFAGGVLQGNVDAALGADFEIAVNGAASLTAADLVL